VPRAELRLSTHARKAYEKLAHADRRLFRRVDRALDRLTEDPQAGKPLHGPLAYSDESGHRFRAKAARVGAKRRREAQVV
jgi:hypothetical protein